MSARWKSIDAAHLLQVGFVPGQQIVDDDDLAGAFAQQRADDGGADEPGPSGDNVVAHRVAQVESSAISRSRWRRDSPAMASAPGVKSKASSEIQPA